MEPSTRKRAFIAAALLAIVVGAVIVRTFVFRSIREAREAVRVTERKQDMIEIAKQLALYQATNHRLPQASGSKFLAALGGSAIRPSAFAARDNERYPIAQYPGLNTEVLAADIEGGADEPRTCKVVLWADGSIGTLDYSDPAIAPLLDKGRLVVGPNSPLEALRKLSLD